MDTVILMLGGGLVLGGLHALDADHVCTVSALILERHPLRKTFLLSLRWSLGHSFTLLVLAGLMFGMKTSFVSLNMEEAERVVGFSMICLGFWVIYREWNRGKGDSHSSRSGLALFGMGVLHGTAGSSSVFLLIPIALSQSLSMVLAYVFLFSVGMILTMGLYSILVNRIIWVERLAHQLNRLRYFSALVAMVVGLQLVLRNF